MNKVLKTRVDEAGFTAMLERLGNDCRPDQFIREFVKNSIESIQRLPEQKGQIQIDVNWDLLDESGGAPKISFTDQGDGMSDDELIKNINHLSSTGQNNEHENFGMGAKISSFTRNKAGVSYESWKDSSKDGAMIIISYNEIENAYGLTSFEDSITQDVKWATVPNNIPKFIKEAGHGTRVTLFGDDFNMTNTMDKADGVNVGNRESWIMLYLNSRFFEIPSDIKIKVRIGYYRDRDDTKHNHLLFVSGQKNDLDKNSLQKGSLPISDATIHWWIMKKGRKDHGRHRLKGHCGLIHENETFGCTDGRSNRAANFGIIFGASDVVLYVEPNKNKYEQDSTRTNLRPLKGGELPWDRWYDEFREKMPQELKNYISRIMDQASGTDDENLRSRLKKVMKFFKLTKYRPDPSGAEEADPDSIHNSLTGRNGEIGGSGSTSSRIGGANPGAAAQILASMTKPGGINSSPSTPDPFPEVKWVSLSEGTRDKDEMEDRAAQYLPSDNLIKINSDFQGFRDIINHYVNDHQGIEGAGVIIRDSVREAFSQILMEAVAGTIGLKGRKHWDPDGIKSAYSEEALTTVCMLRYHQMENIKRTIGSKLGKRNNKEQIQSLSP